MPIHPRRLFSLPFLSLQLINVLCMLLAVSELNAALIVNAGPDQTVSPGTVVQLDGSASIETDGSIATYHWQQLRGPQVSIVSANSANASFTMPENAELAFALHLVSDTDEVATDQVIVRSDPNLNTFPIADAGADQTINSGTRVQLDGSGSSDPDGSIVRYSWYQGRGPSVELQESHTATPSFSMPANAELTFTLVVIDNSGSISRDSVLIQSSENNNQLPIASAGADLAVDSGVTVQLDGSGSSDPDGSIVRYNWYQSRGPSVELQESHTATPNFLMPANTELTFTLAVIDNSGSISRDSVLIQSSENNNQLPIASAGADQTVVSGVTVQLDGSGSSDPDGSIFRYNWYQSRGPSVELQERHTATPSFSMPANAELTFTLAVIDNSGSISRDSVLIQSSENNNQLPIASAGADQTVVSGVTVQLDGSGSSDPDGSIFRYNWYQSRGPSVELQERHTATPSFSMPANAELTFTLAVIDNSGSISRDSVLIQSSENNNQLPIASAGADQTVDSGVTVQLDGSGSSDPDGSIFRYSWYQGRGPSVELQESHTATPSFSMPANAELTFTLVVIDNSGSISRDSVLIQSTENNNQQPIASAGADQTVDSGVTVQLDGSGSSDPDGSIVRYNWYQSRGPSVELQESHTASPSFLMPANAELTFTLAVIDNSGSISRDSVLIQSSENSNQLPIANGGEDREGVEGSVIILDGEQSSSPNGVISSYQWEQVSGPVAQIYWGDLNSSQVAFRLPEVDIDTPILFRLVVTDDQGSSSSDEITISVLDNIPPEAISLPIQTVVEGNYHLMDAMTLFRVQPGDSITLESYRWSQISGPPVTLQYKQYREQARILAPEVDDTTQLIFEVTATDRSGALGRNTIVLNIIRREDVPENILPQANAGLDRVSLSNHYIVVDGALSSDPDGEIVSYEWEIIDSPSNPQIILQRFLGDSNYSTAFTTPVNYVTDNVAGDYTIRLTVTDDKGGTATDDVVITLNPDVNTGEAPIANAGPDRRTSPHYWNHEDRLRLNSSDSTDSDGSIDTIYWQQISGPAVELINSGFEPLPIHDSVRYVFLLTVVDDQGNQNDDMMYWSVGYTNSMPSANFIQPQIVALSGGTLQLDGSGSYDNDDYIASFNWTQSSGPNVTFLDNSAEPVIQLPYVNDVSRVDIGLSVTDLSGAESNIIDDESFLIVNPDYENSIISAGDDIAVFSNGQVELTGQVLIPQQCDPLGGCTDYGRGLTWYQLNGPPILNSLDSGDALSFTAPMVDERTTITLALVDVYNSLIGGLVAMAVDPISIEVLPVTQGIIAMAGTDQQALENTQVIFDGSASQAQTGAIVNFKWEQVKGPEALIANPDDVSTQVYLPAVGLETELAFILTVTSDEGLEAYDVIKVTVSPNLTDGDYDADGVADDVDLFPRDSTEAYDIDGDRRGDNNDFDRDGDSIDNRSDFYPNDPARHAIPAFEIIEPLDEAVINSDYVIVKGTITTDQNLGITVNGIIAERIDGPNGNQFIARVPLAEGENQLIATATSLSRMKFSKSISVTREGQDPVDFYVTDKSNLAPFTNTFSFANSLGATIVQIEVDYEGDSVYDETITSSFNEEVFYYYGVPGIYYPQARFTLANGEQYIVKQVVNVISHEQLDLHIRDLWDSMNFALVQQNHQLAVGYLADQNRDKYSEIFYLLLPYFSDITQSYSPLNTYKIYSSYASYVVNRDIEGVDHAFIVSFIQGSDGLWRVSSM